MKMIDFEYNGKLLSDYGLYLCNFDGSNDTHDVGNIISINKIKAQNSNKYRAAGYSYEDTYSVELQICKFSCEEENDYIISESELNPVIRWLNRKSFYKFKPIYDNNDFNNIYYEGTFNIKVIKVGYDIVGLNLTLVTNAPFGYMEPINNTFEFNDILTDKFIINDISDEVGHLYCKATIKCLETGDIKIKNSLDINNEVIIKNCKVDEIITLYGEEKIITSSLDGHVKLYNDFNYNFFRVVNTYEDNVNNYTSNLRCEITVSYSPIRKVGIIV